VATGSNSGSSGQVEMAVIAQFPLDLGTAAPDLLSTREAST
jgi:hypothetical protein